MKARSVILYTVLRLAAFLVPFGIFMLFPIMRQYYLLAAVFAALIGLSLSLLFLRRPLEEVTAGIAERRSRSRERISDEEAEDAAAEVSDPSTSAAASAPESADEGPEEEPGVRDRGQ